MDKWESYLQPTAVVDSNHPQVCRQASLLASPGDEVATARNCFTFVRDDIQHSRDFERGPATCRASDVLREGTGYCYAKSHLLAALLRANGIPAGFCYQRLSINDTGAPYSLHGYNAVYLRQYGWYRLDARGNRTGISAQFDPPIERLAFTLNESREFDFQEIRAEPLACVVDALHASADWKEVLARLPDVVPEDFATLGLSVRAQGPARK